MLTREEYGFTTDANEDPEVTLQAVQQTYRQKKLKQLSLQDETNLLKVPDIEKNLGDSVSDSSRATDSSDDDLKLSNAAIEDRMSTKSENCISASESSQKMCQKKENFNVVLKNKKVINSTGTNQKKITDLKCKGNKITGKKINQ